MGEAPARYEIAKGEPFVGASGQLLNAVLKDYNVSRDDVMLTNACLCHYPQSMKKLPPEAIVACQPRLLAEVGEWGASVVVPMGNSAVQAVFPRQQAREGITALRAGRPKHSDLLPDAIVVPTFHPAACLRGQEKFPSMYGDIGKAVAPMLPPAWYEPNVHVVTQKLEAAKLFAYTPTGTVIFLDIETGREKDISYGNIHMEKMLCIGIGSTGSDTVNVYPADLFTSTLVRREFINMLKRTQVVCQNGKFDLGVLRSWLGFKDFEPLTLSGDTMLQSYALNEYGGVHGLEYMGMEILGCEDWKHVVKPYLKGKDGKGEVDYANIPSAILYKYNAFDVHVTRLLFSYFQKEINRRGLTQGYEWTIRISNMLTQLEPRGMGFDSEYSTILSEKYTAERSELEQTLPTVSDSSAKSKKLQQPHVMNPDSPSQVKKYLTDAGVKVDTTEADTLKELLNKHQVPMDTKTTIKTILDIRAITKMDGTFVAGMRKRVTKAGRVHPSFLIHGTTSGRLSARNPNSQNIPRANEIKRQFIARDSGRVLVGVDMSQAELRVLTWLAQEEVTRDIFNDPTRDLFVELCRSMFPDKFASSRDDEVKRDPIRPLVKGFAYGMAYGRTASGIAGDPSFNMTIPEAQAHMDTFEKTIPKITRYLREVAKAACNGVDLITPFGRHRRFHLVTEMNKHNIVNEAKAFMAQSTASDIVLLAACRLTEQHHIPIINLVHDAIYTEATEDEAPEIRDIISQEMIKAGEEIVDGYVKFDTEGKIGTSWDQV